MVLNQIQRSAFLAFVLSLTVSPVWAGAVFSDQEAGQSGQIATKVQEEPVSTTDISQISELDPPTEELRQHPATAISERLAQSTAAPVQITGVQLGSTEGLQLRLQTTGELVQPAATSVVGNALIVNIDNAILALPEGNDFQSANPAEGVALITVTPLPGDRVRVTITGVNAPPTVEVRAEAQGLLLSVAPGAAGVAGTEEEAIQVTATGEQDDDYAVDDATTATRTDTPLRDIPQSIQVVPQQVLEDQRVSRVSEALQNVSGVRVDDGFGGSSDRYNIRGFQADIFLQDGFRTGSLGSSAFSAPQLLERIEVLKGPASVLYGEIEPGGVINLVPEQPLSESYYEIEGVVGSFGLFNSNLDLTGPLGANDNLLYRLNALYERNDGFRDYNQEVERFIVAPVFTWDLSDRTSLRINVGYADFNRPFDRGIPAVGDQVADVPRDRLFQDPDTIFSAQEFTIGYRLEHEFNNSWRLRNEFRYLAVDTFDFRLESWGVDDSGILERRWRSNDDLAEFYALQTNIAGEFSTGAIDHTLLFGIDLNRATSVGEQRRLPGDPTVSRINIFDDDIEVVDRPDLDDLTLVVRDENRREDSLGIYLQDQIAFTDNFKALIGGRFEIFDLRSIDLTTNTITEEVLNRFTPRIGLVYQPSDEISLYTSYSQSFNPDIFSTTVEGSLLEPETSEQFEIGIRGEFLDGRLIANLAAFDITKQNVAAPDPDNSDFSLAVGEINSRGLELDVIGEISDGWNVIASYAYTDAEVTEVTFIPEGNRPDNVPEHSASLWTTYEIQSGNLQGLGFGLGVFFVGARPGDFENTYELESYVRTDAAIYYRRNNWRAALNFKNLFDVNYIRYSEGFREANTPGEPFSITGSISVAF